uniref:centrosomal protein of 72 kDa isoform X2 n=1 Tax=Jaculus jaculus TaxID=51337 RepID=UPI001E1B1D06|nr:centrosomal protein of 72 kDa isoform X2 [Jaculus jaculus]
MAAAVRLVLSEETVRERSGFGAHGDLAELRSLSIPGTYQEKITHLGNSLMHLTGLRSLDLSRNSLVSLEGIQYLSSLESLNLYYNSISTLSEVFRLHSLAKLQDVDLRLNPVVKNDSEYRLFVVYLLPNLRQLDDRPVRESERKASQLHFASGDSLDSSESFPATLTTGRQLSSRARSADALASKRLAMDADDEAVLNLIAECEWDLRNPPGSPGSGRKELDADLHHAQDSMETEDSTSFSPKSSLSSQNTIRPLPVPEMFRKRRIPGGRFQVPLDPGCPSCLQRPDGPSSLKQSLSGRDGLDSSTHVAFSCPELSEVGEQTSYGPSDIREPSPQVGPAAAPGPRASLETALPEALLDLVDRWWSGSGSLHSNEAFLAQARNVLSSVQEPTAAQSSPAPEKEGAGSLALENKCLQRRLAEQQQQHTATVSAVTAELQDARKELDTLRQRLDKSLEENNDLKSLLFSMKKEAKTVDPSTVLTLQITGLQASMQQLSGEVVELKQLLEHYDKIQELTRMLQDSHSSLVSTNEHLLQELSRTRAQHRVEMEQMRRSFQEFKKTASLFPPHGARLGGRQSC